MDQEVKYFNLYLLRIIAAIGVIIIHVTGAGSVFEISVDSFARSSIPVFVLISGYCILPKADSLSYVLKKSCRLFLIMLFWSLIYFLFYNAIGRVSYTGVKNFIKYLLTEPISFWYLYMTIGLYLIAPALKVFADHAEKRLFLYVLVLGFLFGSVVTMAERSGISPVFNLILEKSKIAYNIGFPFLFLSGSYIRRFGIARKYRLGMYILGILAELSAICCKIYAFHANAYSELLSSFYAPSTILLGIAVFVAVMNIPENRFSRNARVQKAVKDLASLTFGMYIIHPILIDYLKSVEFASGSVCLMFLVVFSGSLLAVICIQRLPLLNKSI